MQFCKPEPMSFNSRAFGQLPGSRPIYDSPFSFSHQNSVSKTQLHVYSYHLMIRPPRKCHERNQFMNSYYYMNDLSHKVWEARREYTLELQIIVSYFHLLFFLLEYIDTVPFFSLESPEVYDTGKCTEFDRKLLNSFIMNDVI